MLFTIFLIERKIKHKKKKNLNKVAMEDYLCVLKKKKEWKRTLIKN